MPGPTHRFVGIQDTKARKAGRIAVTPAAFAALLTTVEADPS